MRTLAAILLVLMAASSWPPSARAEEKAVGVDAQHGPADAPKGEGQPQGDAKRLEPPAATQAIPGKVVDDDAQREKRSPHGDAADHAAERVSPWEQAASAATALATIALVVATGFLWWATRKLVIGADRNAARQLRAYVGIEDVRVTRRAVHGGAVNLAVKIRNFGQVPAKNVAIAIAWADQRRGHGLRPEDVHPDNPGPMCLMPDAVEEVGRLHTTAIVLTDSVVVGRVTYEDGFGRARCTTFRLLSRLGSDRFSPDNYGNDAD